MNIYIYIRNEYARIILCIWALILFYERVFNDVYFIKNEVRFCFFFFLFFNCYWFLFSNKWKKVTWFWCLLSYVNGHTYSCLLRALQAPVMICTYLLYLNRFLGVRI